MSRVRLFIAGDFCSKPSTSFISVSDELRNAIQSCDIKVVNFEVPLKPSVDLPPRRYERFWQHDDAPKFLFDLGFNLFTIGNNHAFDWGEDGFVKTHSALGSSCFGAGTYEDAYKVKICEINGIRIGFLALCYAAHAGVFNDVLHHEGLGCAYINDLRVNHDIIAAKKVVDYLFILPHDGIEYIDVPLPETIARYRDFIDYGADGVIACHPHCPQGWEEYRGKPIFYSLGNFFFNSKEDPSYRAWYRPHWYEGLCVELDLYNGQIKYKTINTRNVNNVALVIDPDLEREEHNRNLCFFLKNKEAYLSYLYTECKKLKDGQEMPIIDKSLHPVSLKSYTKTALRNWIKILKKQELSSDLSLQALLSNDTRRSSLLIGMKNR
jgi:poly-gamma-glutamate synthesis protein (capsule biosynthesis protein)